MNDEIHKEFDKLDDLYGQTLVEVAKLREIARAYSNSEEDKYNNPFRFAYDKERVLVDECNKDVLRAVRRSMESVYPNLQMTEDTFKACIEPDKNEQRVLNFDKVASKIMELEAGVERLSLAHVEQSAKRLIPYRGYDEEKKPHELSDIWRKYTLVLHSGWSYDRPRTDHEDDFCVFAYYAIYGAAIARVSGKEARERMGLQFKYYKNGRCDAIFANENAAEAVGKALIEKASA